MSVLTAAPYSLTLGDAINVKVAAGNTYGTSELSAMGSGAVIQLVPDAPITLTNDALTSSASQIRFTWLEGASNGGSPVIDYWVYYDQATGDWTELAIGLVNTYSYTTIISLTQGLTYSFKVLARNSVGFSADSSVLAVLAATVPDQPLSVTTTAGASEVVIAWTVDNRGSAITHFLVQIRESDGLTYTAESVACQSDDATVLSSQ